MSKLGNNYNDMLKKTNGENLTNALFKFINIIL